MTALSDFCETLRGWLNFGSDEYPDELITSFVRMAETTLSPILRVKHMLQIDTAVVAVNRVLLPSDWEELDLVRVVGGKTLRYRERDAFYSPDAEDPNYNVGYYTIAGNYLSVADNILNDETIELQYFQNIPPLGQEPNWLLAYYPTLFIMSSLTAAMLYGIEDERAAGWQANVERQVAALNEEYLKSKASGSILKPRRAKGFG